ncbi:hypothetical protein V0M98_35120 (plasmid) [Pseudomonas silesiensis]|uniref:hypothetical protein n=1 Tax=Pseudomonas silesiensis TaxID=1853130 RepID=UPI0030D18A44
MKVKIEGVVTADRLRIALEGLVKTFEDTFGDDFAGFFGANLYVQAYNTDGEQIEVYEGGKEMALKLPLRPDTPTKPPLSEAVRANRAEQAKRVNEERKEAEQSRREIEEQHLARKARYEHELAAWKQHIETFQAVASRFGNDLIRDCNAAITTVWNEHKPVWPNGNKKDLPRAKPYLAIAGGVVLLFTGSRPGDSRRIKTPLMKDVSMSGVEAFWQYDEWKEVAVPAMAAVIEGYAKKLQAPENSQELEGTNQG